MWNFFDSVNNLYVLVGSGVLGALGGLIGAFAVLRRQGLLGDALAHAALPGIVVAFILMEVKFLPGLLLGALVSGLIGAALIYFLVTHTKVKMDSAMAAVLSVFFGLGILLLTYLQKQPISSQSGLDDFIFGQAAALLAIDVYWIVGIFVAVLVVVLLFWKELKVFTFNEDFARVLGFKRSWMEAVFLTVFVLAILVSLQAVGVILTAALFITPAVAARFWSEKLSVVVFLSALFGAFGGGLGAVVSSSIPRMPTGPVIVVITTFIFLVSFFLAPKKGLLSVWLHQLARSRKIQMENVLAKFYRDYEKGKVSWDIDDFVKLGYKMQILESLIDHGYLRRDGSEIRFSSRGEKFAASILKKHRLWETYLVNQLQIAPDQVHRDAEDMEHLLTDEVVAKLMTILKDPTKDPHGKLIPKND